MSSTVSHHNHDFNERIPLPSSYVHLLTKYTHIFLYRQLFELITIFCCWIVVRSIRFFLSSSKLTNRVDYVKISLREVWPSSCER